VNEAGLAQLEFFFGLAVSTLVWSIRSSINYPKMSLVVEIRWDG
jgi:hypothetical protein